MREIAGWRNNRRIRRRKWKRKTDILSTSVGSRRRRGREGLWSSSERD
jgi:hypothetical protein